MTSPSTIRIGVVGLGAVAQSVHLPLIRRRPELFTLAAVADISPSLLNAVGRMHCVNESSRYAGPETMIEHADLDAVLICSAGSHEPLVVAALQRGIAVLCEKPLAFTHVELARIRAALPTSGPPRLMVGYMKQYDPATITLRGLLSEVDDVRSVVVTVLHPTGQSQLDFAHLLPAGGDVPQGTIDAARRTDRVLQDVAFGAGNENRDLWRVYSGCLMSSLSHDMAVIRTLFNPVSSIDFADIWRVESRHQQRTTGRDAGGLGEKPPSIRAVGTNSDHTRFLLDWHYLHDYPSYRETVRVIHGSGSFELAFPSPYLLHAPTVLTRYSSVGAAEARTEFRNTAESFEVQLEAFADMFHHGIAPFTDITGAEHDVITSQAIIGSYAKRQGIVLGGELGEQ